MPCSKNSGWIITSSDACKHTVSPSIQGRDRPEIDVQGFLRADSRPLLPIHSDHKQEGGNISDIQKYGQVHSLSFHRQYKVGCVDGTNLHAGPR